MLIASYYSDLTPCLFSMILDGNVLSGAIPTDIGKLTQLYDLLLSKNS